MSTILEQVIEKRQKARSEKDQYKTEFYTTLLGEFGRKSKEISDKEAIALLNSSIKRINKFYDEAEEKGVSLSEEQKSDFERQKELYSEFLPPELSEEKIKEFAAQANNIGQFMGSLNKYAKQEGLNVDNQKARKIFESQ